MIINLVGQIATGKTSFAKWFIQKYPSWIYLDIAQERKLLSQINQIFLPIQKIEKQVWYSLQAQLSNINRNYLIESTGTIYKLKTLWTTEVIKRGIYTINFMAPLKICQERSNKRNNMKEIDESYAIIYEDELCQYLSANLIVNMNSLENQEIKFQLIEKYIIRAKIYFDLYQSQCIIGQNKIV